MMRPKSPRLLNRLFNIYPHEWPRVLFLCLIVAMANASVIWGKATVYAAFLQEAGIEALPLVLVLGALLSVLAIAIYTAFVDRIANRTLLIAIYVFATASIGLGLGLLWLDFSLIAYPLLYLLLTAWLAVDIPHFITYVNSFYDTQSAKRVLPVVSAGSRVGGIIGGLSMPLLTARFAPDLIIVLWLVVYVFIIGLIWFMPYLLEEKKTLASQSARISPAVVDSEKQRSPYIDNIREGLSYTSQSIYLRWMALGTLLLMILVSVVEYRSSEILLEIYKTPEELARFLAVLVGAANFVILPLLLFVMGRLIARLGVGNASLLFPAGNLVICGGLILSPGGVSAAAGYLNRNTLRNTFQGSIDSLLYNAVPLRVKGRARAFVGGLIIPVGSLIGGLLLFLPLVSTVGWFVPTLIGVLAIAYTVSVWFIRRQYGQALVKMLEQEDYSFLLSPEASDLTVTDPAALKQLQQKLEESSSPEFTIFMAQLISQVGGNQAVPILGTAARAATDPHIRATIVDLLTAANTRGDAVRQLHTDFLTDPHRQVRQSAIAGLEQLAGPTDRQFISRMLEMIQDPDIDVSVRALSALVHSGDFYRLTPAVRVLDQLLAGEDPQRRAYGVRVLGEIGYYRAIRDLLEYLTDPADEVRLEAVVAVEALSHSVLPRSKARNNHIDLLVVEKISPLLQDPVERVRRAALVVLGRLASYESYPDLVGALTDSSPQVRATAADTLVQIGKAVISTVHLELDSPDPQIRKMAAVILSRINRREFGPLVNANITGNLLAIYHNHNHLEALRVYDKYQSIPVLQNALRDQNQQLIDEIFYLLTAIHDPRAIRAIDDSLASEIVRVRDNAIEALEALTSPETAQLMAPLFEPDLPPAQLLNRGQEAWEMIDPDPVVTIKQLAGSETAWLRAIMVYALGEIGADLRTPETADMQTDTSQPPLTLPEIETILAQAVADPVANVQFAAQVAKQMIAGQYSLSRSKIRSEGIDKSPIWPGFGNPGRAKLDLLSLDLAKKEDILLSVVEKIIFLKEVPFFQGMTVNQLEVLANVCEEELFEEDSRIFDQGDPGGVLYVVVNGKVGIEREGARKGSTVRLATLGSHSYFGEMTLFDNSPRSAAAIALQDTLILSLRREPLIALARQYPDLSLELINVLSQRLRESNDRIAKLTRTKPRELQKLFDKLD